MLRLQSGLTYALGTTRSAATSKGSLDVESMTVCADSCATRFYEVHSSSCRAEATATSADFDNRLGTRVSGGQLDLQYVLKVLRHMQR